MLNLRIKIALIFEKPDTLFFDIAKPLINKIALLRYFFL